MSILTYARYLPGTFNPVGALIPLLKFRQKTFFKILCKILPLYS